MSRMFAAIAVALVWSAYVASGAMPPTEEVDAVEMHVAAEFGRQLRVAAHGETLYIVDTTQHRVWIVEGDRTHWIGGIGHGPGDLYYPVRAVSRGDHLYVLDEGNARVQVFRPDGSQVRQIPYDPPAYGLAIFSNGDVLVASPRGAATATVYGADGTRRRFGRMLRGDSIPGKPVGYRVAGPLELALNRTAVAVGRRGEIWVMFLHLPIIQKWTEGGRLEWQRRLTIDGLDVFSTAAWQQPPPKELPSVGDGRVQLTLVLKDLIAVDDGATVLLGDGRLVDLNGSGDVRRVIVPSGSRLHYNSVTWIGGRYVLSRFLTPSLFAVGGGVDRVPASPSRRNRR